DLELVGRALDVDARDTRVREAALEFRPQLAVLVQELRVGPVGEPARSPRLVEPQPGAVGMNFLTHSVDLLRCLLRATRPRRRTRRSLHRALGHFHRQVRHPLDDAERAAHRGRADALHARPLVGEARLDVEPVDVAAEVGPLLRVGNGRPQRLLDVAGDDLAREAQRRQRVRHIGAANLIQHEPGLLGRRADVLRRGLRPGHYEPPLPATCAAFSALVVCPLNSRVGANSPSLCPTMFSVMYTGMNLRPLCTATVWPTISGTTVDRRDQVLMTRFSLSRFIASTFSRRCRSMNGPFLSDLPMVPLDYFFFRSRMNCELRLLRRVL